MAVEWSFYDAPSIGDVIRSLDGKTTAPTKMNPRSVAPDELKEFFSDLKWNTLRTMNKYVNKYLHQNLGPGPCYTIVSIASEEFDGELKEIASACGIVVALEDLRFKHPDSSSSDSHLNLIKSWSVSTCLARYWQCERSERRCLMGALRQNRIPIPNK